MEAATHWTISTALVTSSVIAITANSFLLLIFCRRRALRTVPNRFVINLMLTNLLSSLLLIPLLLVDQSVPPAALTAAPPTNESVEISVVREIFTIQANSTIIETSERDIVSSLTFWNTSAAAMLTNERALCTASQLTTSFVTTLSILSILLIGINQYFGVLHSLRYHFYINKCRSSILIASTWLAAIIFAALSLLTDSDANLWRYCDTGVAPNKTEALRIMNSFYACAYFVIVILAPFSAICVIYVCIYRAAHLSSERMRKSTSANLDGYKEEAVVTTTATATATQCILPKVQSAPNFTHIDRTDGDSGANVRTKVTRTCSDRANFITNLRHKISNVSVFKYREETRAAKISVLVIFLVLFCYVPYGVTLVLNSGMIGVVTSRVLNHGVLLLLVLSNVISPFLFGYRNKRVKREIGRVFGVAAVRSERVLQRRRSTNDAEHTSMPFLADCVIPEVVVTCRVEHEKKSILKKMCSSSSWKSKRCNFITVPDSCMGGEARGSFSSASTQISNEDC